ncbi:GFA family protein [Tepidamorphus sp. 3E244]|uniref:GFA family protein n=1 Tax=Tepidamorphus sp. 3E244 TaxID=3385498 RepID=UPI0038FC1817
MTYNGSCQCGAVKITADAEPAFAAHCHCLDCQKSSGAGHLTFAFFPQDSVSVTGELSEFTVAGDSGGSMTRSFCPTCGGRVIGRIGNLPGLVGVTLGILDESDGIVPQAAVYAKRLRKWDTIPEGVQAFEEMPPQG